MRLRCDAVAKEIPKLFGCRGSACGDDSDPLGENAENDVDAVDRSRRMLGENRRDVIETSALVGNRAIAEP